MAGEVMEKGSLGVEEQSGMAKPSLYVKAQLTLRVLAIISTLIAISVIVTASQTITIFSIQFTPRYFHSSAFRFLVGADAVVCACSVMSVMCVYHLRRSESYNSEAQLANKHFLIFLHDTVMLVLVATGCAAATAIGYVGRHGEPKMMWQSVCEEVPKFCDRMFVGSVFSYVAFFAYLALTLVSARRLMISLPTATTSLYSL